MDDGERPLEGIRVLDMDNLKLETKQAEEVTECDLAAIF